MQVHATYIYKSALIMQPITKLILIQTVRKIKLNNCSMKTHHPSLYPPL